ncbi:MAG: DUF805 domain-containing protein [Pseudomonadota bacterium]
MLDLLFNPNGRMSRKGFLVVFLAPYLLLTKIMAPIFMQAGLSALPYVASIFFLWPSAVSVPVKRFHDMGASGWYQAGIIGLQVLAGIIILNGVVDIGGGGAISDPALSPLEQQKALWKLIGQSPKAQLGVVLWAAVVLAQTALFAFAKGMRGRNRYGSDPLSTEQGFGS